MLIKFSDICAKYGEPRGVIHVGAHMMEERDVYLSKGLENTIWVEANPSVYEKAKATVQLKQNEMLFNFAISDTDGSEVDFHVTNNGESSSILELGIHKDRHPEVWVSDTIQVKTKRMDTLMAEKGISIDQYNFLNLDVQGAELLVLRGFGKAAGKFDLVYTEVNSNYLYKGCALIGEIDEYLATFGFRRTETEMTRNEWGDALYTR